jgi:2-amino-4-hydroxy-6-hydroxymethyldihydropteridine diphosphokinase
LSGHVTVIALGSNLGDRLAHLQSGVDAMVPRGLTPLVVSSVYETDPVGGPEQDPYLNAVVIAVTFLDPQEVLAACQSIEAERDRSRDVRWGPRTLDLDVIAYDDIESSDPTLTLPHPRAHERAFVCTPWMEIDAAASVGGRPLAELVCGLGDAGVVRRDDMRLHLQQSLGGTGT